MSKADIIEALDASHLIGYREAVIEAIAAAFPALQEVKSHGGTFSEAQLKRYSDKAPCVRVAILGVQKNQLISTGEMRGPVRMAAYVIAEDIAKAQSFDVAMALAEQIAGFIQGNAFAYPRAGMANVTEVQNLFSLESEKRGITIVAAAWQADVRIGVDTYALESGESALSGATLNTLYVDENGQQVDAVTAEALGL